MKEDIARAITTEDTVRVMALDGTTAEDVINKEKTNKFNDMVDAYEDRFNKHAVNVQKFAEKINETADKIEILPLGAYVLVKQFEQNPFQRIVKTKSGIILDTGGFAPQYKNTDNGEYEEEEPFILVGVVQEVGPECKYLKAGDAVFYSKPSSIPVPFYKQNLIQVHETRILAAVNENLKERFKSVN